MKEYPQETNEIEDEEENLLIAAKFRTNNIAPGTRGINWYKARTGWTRYFDDGVVTLDPKVFFRKRKKHE